MTGSDLGGSYRVWDWDSADGAVGARDYLLVAGETLYFQWNQDAASLQEFKSASVAPGPKSWQERLEELERKKSLVKLAHVIPFKSVTSVEHVTLLMSHVLHIRYVTDDGKAHKLRLKIPPKDALARQVFDELRAMIAPTSAVTTVQASVWECIRGPVWSLIIGGGWLVLMAIGSTSKDLAWQERSSPFYAVVGWLIRFLGPIGMGSIAAVWIGTSALLLRHRLRHRPSKDIWRVS